MGWRTWWRGCEPGTAHTIRILAQLRTQVSPRFAPYRMDRDTLDAHARWAHPLSAADERKLARLKRHPHLADVAGLIDHMLNRGIKLEQEAVRVGRRAAAYGVMGEHLIE